MTTLRVHDRNEDGDICPPEYQVACAEAYEKFEPLLTELLNNRPASAGPINNQFAGWFPLPGLYETTGAVIGFRIDDNKVSVVTVINEAKADQMLDWRGKKKANTRETEPYKGEDK
jgi:hypothetical protein